MNIFIATYNDEGRTILKFIQRIFKNLPSSVIEKTFRKKDIKINGKRINDKKIIIREGDEIVIYGIKLEQEKVEIKANINFKVVYENNDILVVDKKPGVTVHGEKDSLDNQVLSYLKWKNIDSFQPSHIGRLDKVTSGLMIYGKTYKALRILKENQSYFKKLYEFKSDLNENIETKFKIEHNEELKKEVVGKFGKPSHTIFTIKNNKKYAQLMTGRKHQIRVSLSKLGFPIYGDLQYGGKKAKRVYLHCLNIKIQNLPKELDYLNNLEFWSETNW